METKKQGELLKTKRGDLLFANNDGMRVIVCNGQGSIAKPFRQRGQAEVVAIMPTLQIIMGMEISVLEAGIKMLKIPLVLISMLDGRSNSSLYKLRRLGDSEVDTYDVCRLGVRGNSIRTLFINKEIIGDERIRKVDRLSIIHQIILCDSSETAEMKIMKAKHAISAITSCAVGSVQVRGDNTWKVIYARVKDSSVEYVFKQGKLDRMELSEIVLGND